MNSKNLLKTKKYIWNIIPKSDIIITSEQYVEYIKQKDIIKQLCDFINSHGYTIHKEDNFIYTIEENRYMEENNEISIN